MFGAIRHNLANLANVRGRDARPTYWYYLLFVLVLRFIAAIAISLPMTMRVSAIGIEAARTGADSATVQAQTMAATVEILPLVTWAGVALAAVTALLLVASLVRRLHDFGMSGWWALLPAGLQGLALAQTQTTYHHVMEVLARAGGGAAPNAMTMVQGQGMLALLGWLPALVVIVIGLVGSNPGPNRFGEKPVNF